MNNFNKYLKDIVLNEKPNDMLIGRGCRSSIDKIINDIKEDKDITFGEFIVISQIFQKCVETVIHINNYKFTIGLDSVNPIYELEDYVLKITGRWICAYSDTIPEMKKKLKGFNFDIEVREVETFTLDETKDMIKKIKESRKN